MSNVTQKAILTAKISGIITELMVKTSAEQVFVDDTTTLATKLSELVAALEGTAASSHTHAQADVTGLVDDLAARPTTDTMNSAISTAISGLINGAPETYDTLKEIADYIDAHQDVVDALNATIGSKADVSVVTTLQETVSAIKTTVDGLGALATKNLVTENDLDENLVAKVNAASDGNHSHSNMETLNSITSDKIAAWDGKSKIYFSATQPENLAEGDLWAKVIES